MELYIKDIPFDEALELQYSTWSLPWCDPLVVSGSLALSSADMATECGWMSSGKSPFYGSIMVGFSSYRKKETLNVRTCSLKRQVSVLVSKSVSRTSAPEGIVPFYMGLDLAPPSHQGQRNLAGNA